MKSEVIIYGEFITIGQLLKKLQFIDSGGGAKFFLEQNKVLINGNKPTGRGTKIYANSSVWINDQLFLIKN